MSEQAYDIWQDLPHLTGPELGQVHRAVEQTIRLSQDHLGLIEREEQRRSPNQAALFHGHLGWNNNHVEHITVENKVEPIIPGKILTCGRWVLCKVVEDGWRWEWDDPETTNGGW